MAAIHREWGNGTEQGAVTHPLELAAGRGLCQSCPPAPSPEPRLVLVDFCPRHESLELLGKGKTEFSKPQEQADVYLLIHLLPPARQGGGKVGAEELSQEQSLSPGCCWPSKRCSSSWSWKGFLP